MSIKIVNETGGARIGRVNVTWPFASLNATETQLTLNATLIGKLIFKPNDIKSIEVYDYFPIIGQGIKINHTIDTYKSHVVFWTFKDPTALLNEIEATGFLNKDSKVHSLHSEEVTLLQKTGGFPLKLSFAIAIVILWNVLFFVDATTLFNEGKILFGFGKGLVLSTGMILLASILLLVSTVFQKIALKEGRKVKDISKFIYFIILVVGILFLSRIVIFM